MAWLESHQSLGRHIKTKRLSRKLGITVPATIGHLHLLWWWAMDNLPDGCISLLEPEDIADEMMWTGDADELLNALIDVGFIDEIDGQLFIHDWHDYIGKLLQSREKKSNRTSEMRKAYQDGTINKVKNRDCDCCRYCGNEVDWTDRKTGKGGTYDHVDPDGPTTFENLVVACRSCNSRKGKRLPEGARMPLIPLDRIKRLSNDSSNGASDDHLTTVQYSTEQYSTENKNTTTDKFARIEKAYATIHKTMGLKPVDWPIVNQLLEKGVTADLIIEVMEEKHAKKIQEGGTVNGFSFYTNAINERFNQGQRNEGRLDFLNDL
ncbi:HNH endonuclease [Paenibacillus sp. Dod16]|uniref:HNH endonuclease n=1 Tax=Paenibacillus sp. Dod16 TaxID=3416392 RepID=UPI003CE772CB